MTLRCEACGEVAWDDAGRYCIACGGRLVAAPDPPPRPEADPEPEPEPRPDFGRAGPHAAPEPPESADADRREPDFGRAGPHAAPERPESPLPAPPRPVREREGAGGDEVPVALVLAGVVALLLVLLGLLLLT